VSTSLRDFGNPPILGTRSVGYYWVRRRINRTEEPLVLFFHGFHHPSRPTDIEPTGHWSYSPSTSWQNRFTGTEFGITYVDQCLGRMCLVRDDLVGIPMGPRPGIILELPL
jgi:hypothetical protein